MVSPLTGVARAGPGRGPGRGPGGTLSNSNGRCLDGRHLHLSVVEARRALDSKSGKQAVHITSLPSSEAGGDWRAVLTVCICMFMTELRREGCSESASCEQFLSSPTGLCPNVSLSPPCLALLPPHPAAPPAFVCRSPSGAVRRGAGRWNGVDETATSHNRI